MNYIYICYLYQLLVYGFKLCVITRLKMKKNMSLTYRIQKYSILQMSSFEMENDLGLALFLLFANRLWLQVVGQY